MSDIDVTQIVNDSNKVLKYLVQNVDPDWDTVLRANLNDSEYKTAVDNAVRMHKKHATPGFDIHGAVGYGTGQLLDFNNINAGDGRVVLKILKARGSLLQCGRGRGKALVLVHYNKDYVSEQEVLQHLGITQPEQPELFVEPPQLQELKVEVEAGAAKGNVANLLRDATDEFRHMHQELTECKRLLSQKDARIKNLLGELEAKDLKIADLTGKLDQIALTNWT